jgi:hypothetical protein
VHKTYPTWTSHESTGYFASGFATARPDSPAAVTRPSITAVRQRSIDIAMNQCRRLFVRSLLPVAALTLFALSARAQETPPAPDPVPAPQDTVPLDAETIPSPRGAFLRSLVIPGWGQAWVGAPVRGGVYFAMEAGALWMTVKSRQKLREARRDEAWMRETGQLGLTQRSELVTSRRAQVEDWTTLAIFFLFFAGADAFVSAHLADFGEHVGVAPEAAGGFRLQATLPVGHQNR